MFALVRDELVRSGFNEIIAAGVVLTGGSSKMEGAVELAEEVFHTQVRLGAPQHVAGLVEVVRNPIHATGVGLLIYGLQHQELMQPSGGVSSGFGEVLDRMMSWFKGNF
jgi:cell division protein FtsA